MLTVISQVFKASGSLNVWRAAPRLQAQELLGCINFQHVSAFLLAFSATLCVYTPPRFDLYLRFLPPRLRSQKSRLRPSPTGPSSLVISAVKKKMTAGNFAIIHHPQEDPRGIGPILPFLYQFLFSFRAVGRIILLSAAKLREGRLV